MNIIEEFDKKIETYDKNGGFIVYVEEYDNKDFDKNLIRQFILKALADQKEELTGNRIYGISEIEYNEIKDIVLTQVIEAIDYKKFKVGGFKATTGWLIREDDLKEELLMSL